MNGGKQASWLFLIIILLAFSGWYIVSSSSVKLTNEQTLETTIDATASRLSVRQFTPDGVLANKLFAPLMTHIPKNNVHNFSNPTIYVTQNDNTHSLIQSQTATSFEGGQEITFADKVLILQTQNSGGENIEDRNTEATKATEVKKSTIKTELLHYKPQDKFVWTKALVIFEQNGNVVQSTGMKAYLDKKNVELLSEASATYVPHSG